MNEAYLRVRRLRALAGDNILAFPIVGMTHGVVMLLFMLLIGGYVAASMVSQARRRHRVSHVASPRHGYQV